MSDAASIIWDHSTKRSISHDLYDLPGIAADGSGNLDQFHHFDTPLAVLVLSNEGLRPFQALKRAALCSVTSKGTKLFILHLYV